MSNKALSKKPFGDGYRRHEGLTSRATKDSMKVTFGINTIYYYLVAAYPNIFAIAISGPRVAKDF